MASEISVVRCNTEGTPLPQDESLKLPSELLEKCFSYLRAQRDIVSVAVVCKRWNIAAVRRKWEDTLVIKKFAAVLGNHADKLLQAGQMAALCAIEHKETPVPGTLPEVKALIFHLRVDILNVLKNLDKQTMEALKTRVPTTHPDACRYIFPLASFCAQLAAPHTSYGPTKADNYQRIFKTVIAKGSLRPALEMAETISTVKDKSLALGTISKELVRIGRPQQAIKVITNMPEGKVKNDALGYVATVCFKKNRVDLALGALNKIAGKQEKTRIVENVFEKLIEDGTIEKALSIAQALEDEAVKDAALMAISTALARSSVGAMGRTSMSDEYLIKRVLKIADAITNEESKSQALFQISQTLVVQGNAKGAVRVAVTISDEQKKCRILSQISSKLLDEKKKVEQPRYGYQEYEEEDYSYYEEEPAEWVMSTTENVCTIEESLEVARKITDLEEKGIAFEHIFDRVWQTLVKKKEINRLIKIIEELPCNSEGEGDRRFVRICELLVQQMDDPDFSTTGSSEPYIDKVSGRWVGPVERDIDEALEQVLKVTTLIIDQKKRGRVLISVCDVLMRVGDISDKKISQALTIAGTLLEDTEKASAFEHIFSRTGIAQGLKFTDTIASELLKSEALWTLSKAALNRNAWERGAPMKALEIAYLIPDASIRSKALAYSASCEKNSDQALVIISTISDKKIQNEALSHLAEALVTRKHREVDRALEVAHLITDETIKNYTLRNVCRLLERKESSAVDRVLEIAYSITDEKIKHETLKDVCVLLIEKESIAVDRVLEIAYSITDEPIKHEMLKDVCVLLIEKESSTVDRVLEIAYSITDEKIKHETLKDVCASLTQEESIAVDRVLEIAYKISEDVIQEQALAHIFENLVRRNKLDQALDIAYKIVDEIKRGKSLGHIAKTLVDLSQYPEEDKEGCEQALTIAHTISSEPTKQEILSAISKSLVYTQLTLALDTAYSITDDRIKHETLKEIAISLSEQGSIEESLDIAGKISSAVIQGEAFTFILENLLQVGWIDEDLEFVYRVSDEQTRNEIFSKISDVLLNARKRFDEETKREIVTTRTDLSVINLNFGFNSLRISRSF